MLQESESVLNFKQLYVIFHLPLVLSQIAKLIAEKCGVNGISQAICYHKITCDIHGNI